MSDRGYDYALRRVAGPAMGLIVTSALCGVLLLLALAFDLWLVLSGAAEQLPPPGNLPKGTQILVRVVWSLFMLAANGVILLGGIRMRGLQGRAMVRTACVLSVIPCLGPCFLLGIPFGIWGLVVLNDPRVRRAFTS